MPDTVEEQHEDIHQQQLTPDVAAAAAAAAAAATAGDAPPEEAQQQPQPQPQPQAQPQAQPPKRVANQVSDADNATIESMIRSGASAQAIRAAVPSVSRTNVYLKIQKFRKYGTVARVETKTIGRPRVVDDGTEKFILGLMAAKPTIELDEMQHHIATELKLNISTSTISRTISRAGLGIRGRDKKGTKGRYIKAPAWEKPGSNASTASPVTASAPPAASSSFPAPEAQVALAATEGAHDPHHMSHVLQDDPDYMAWEQEQTLQQQQPGEHLHTEEEELSHLLDPSLTSHHHRQQQYQPAHPAPYPVNMMMPSMPQARPAPQQRVYQSPYAPI